jgi:cell division protein FtsB
MKFSKPFYSKNNSKKLIFNTLIFLLLVYFIFHSVYGNLGIIAYFKVNQQFEKSYSELEELRSSRIEIEHRAKLLKSGDKDIIDEKARNILGVASPKEQVFTPVKTEDQNEYKK